MNPAIESKGLFVEIKDEAKESERNLDDVLAVNERSWLFESALLTSCHFRCGLTFVALDPLKLAEVGPPLEPVPPSM